MIKNRLLASGLAVMALPMVGVASVSCYDLKCEHLTNPVGVDEEKPALSWKLKSEKKNQTQGAYRILVASSFEKLSQDQGDLWDSGKVSSEESLHIEYQGKSLDSAQRVFWKVCSWNEEMETNGFSEVNSWTVALNDPATEWKAEWISFNDTSKLHDKQGELYLPPARYYRKQVELSKQVKKATAFASALGVYDLHINGKQVGDAYFAPGWTNYDVRGYYNTYDVTDSLQNGANSIGALVADGWYSGYVGYGKLVGYGPNRSGRNIYGKTTAFSAQILIEYTDGSQEWVKTDKSWKTSVGPILEGDFLMGETYDARKELTGWNTPDYDDSQWQNAILASENGNTKAIFFDQFKQEEQEFGFTKPPILQAYPAQVVRVIEELPAKSVTEASKGAYVFDLGQNFAGNVRLKVTGEAGQKIRLRFAEMLNQDGTVMTENLRQARAQDTYICKGGGEEVWTPRTTFHGFQFVEVTGVNSKPSADMITGLVIHSDTPLVSDFKSNDEVVDKVFQNCIWTQRANFLELPTDCPQRDERLGWTGDAQIYVKAAAYHADINAFYKKWLRELDDSQDEYGVYPSYAPYPFGHGTAIAGTGWSDAGVICPYWMWQMSGDKKFIYNHWEGMTYFMDWRLKHDPALKGKALGALWGDWLNLDDPTDINFIDLCYHAYCAKYMAEMAKAVGKSAEEKRYNDLYAKLAENFKADHLNEDGSLKHQSQTAHLLAYDTGLAEGSVKTKVGQDFYKLLVDRRTAKNTGMTTGFLGTEPLCRVLTDSGNHDTAVYHLQSRVYPSWGYEVVNGATTIWERWNSFTKGEGFTAGNGKMNSFAHYSFGAVSSWMIEEIAGISALEPGFKKILIAPKFSNANIAPNGAKPLDTVSASHISPYGKIESAWKRNGSEYEVTVTIPANTTAEVHLNGKVALVGSGTHTFKTSK